MKIIARIHTEFSEKFGIPRQSGLAPPLEARIVFEEEYRNMEAIRGLDGFEYIWLIWEFSENRRDTWSPTVRPPRLGGNTRLGVFATRSPFRPNPIGLSSVRLERIETLTDTGPTLVVSGADLMDGTPIFDIKPYIPYTDAHPDVKSGFAPAPDHTLAVIIPPALLQQIPRKHHTALYEILAQDPRPSYKADGEHVYGLFFAGYNIRFQVKNNVLSVCGISKISPEAG